MSRSTTMNPDIKRKRKRHSSPSRSRSACSSSDHSSERDDSVGHFSGGRNDVIDSRYVIREEIGLGTFGKVFRCFDKKHLDTVAVKVVRNIRKYVDSAKIEARILNDIYNQMKKQNFDGCVKMYSHFKFSGHYCMVMERLGISLYDLLKKRDHRGLPIELVRSVAGSLSSCLMRCRSYVVIYFLTYLRQLLSALSFLHSFRLIHTDLKVENILFADPELVVGPDGRCIPRSSRIKLIDFGGATYDDEHKTGIICTRQYRGPEVILGLGWSYPADVWSAGCIIAEIYSGELFFATHENTEHLALMEKTLDTSFPRWMCKAATSEFRRVFDKKGRVLTDGLHPDSVKYINKTKNLEFFFEDEKRSGIIEFVRSLLQIDPNIRATARDSSFCTFLRPTLTPR